MNKRETLTNKRKTSINNAIHGSRGGSARGLQNQISLNYINALDPPQEFSIICVITSNIFIPMLTYLQRVYYVGVYRIKNSYLLSISP